MKLQGATVLITGANRGLGLAFAREALARGASKVYAAARDPSRVTLAGVTPIRLDVTKPDEVEQAARECADVTLVINNAGIAGFDSVTGPDAEEALTRHFETNVLGVSRVSRAFAPVLKRNGGGALLNVLSVASWKSSPMLGAYSVSKAAAWGLTNALRADLKPQNTQVTALHVGLIDTDLTRDIDAPKSSPETIVGRAFDALEKGASEALADDVTRQVKLGLSLEPAVYLG
ncbi:SDR family oxidoreductase [Noviherbaspirillum aerium]|uniref:SDR family oxidoreductase n=1 Tax=Noviherbaspirillum aerium TaxID=2588497 RepID=UPI00124E213D|nr:SDR family oxidoreductase [Noviherbaspirillum aerium]